MDIRIEKTERAIRNAFLELRAAKPLEKITVKELCSLACINKSTTRGCKQWRNLGTIRRNICS